MIGKALHYMRNKKGLKQDQIAIFIGTARNTVSQYETGTIQPTFEVIETIANNCDYEIIFRNKNTKEEFKARDLTRKDV